MSAMTVVAVTGDRHLTNANFVAGSQTTENGGSPTTYLLLTAASTPATNPPKQVAPKRSEQSSRIKRKVQLANTGKVHAAPAVARRNERERNRVRQVNLGFATLRQHVPNGSKSKKMSKVETLRSAVQYIKQLQQLLNETTGQDEEENSLPSFEEVAKMTGNHGRVLHQDDYPGTMSLGVTSPPCSAASSPSPSLVSEASSPYDSFSPEDEELLDFTSWLS